MMSIIAGGVLLNAPLAYADEAEAEAEEYALNDYYFDSSLLRGNRFNIGQISQFNVEDVQPGKYDVDIYLNNVFFEKTSIDFIQSKNNKITPCFSYSFLSKLGIKSEALADAENSGNLLPDDQCIILDEVIKGAQSKFMFSSLKLDLSIPQALLNKLPSGYIDPNNLDSGESMIFVNYMANQYHVEYKNSAIKNQNSTYLNLNGGLNFGLWRYRQQSYFNKQSNGESHFSTSNRYIQRAILPLNGELTIGESYTSGEYFSGLGFKGVSIKSDERMLPDSQRGYAPVINGIARTNAKVVVKQGGSIIYETTVPPGPFIIDDLYSTNYAGDLYVTVQEADGSTNTFVVPFSSVPGSLRMGSYRYSFTMGRSRFVGDSDPFAELLIRKGISNSITLNAGMRTAKDYNAGLVGGVYSSFLGAVGIDLTLSSASLPSGSESGWKSRISYSKSFEPTKTSVSASVNYYSRSGYRDLNDVLGVRQSYKHNTKWSSSSYNQRSRIDLSVNQNLGDLGSFYLSGSISDYYGNHNNDTQLQLGYGKTFSNGASLNISINRSNYGASNYNNYLEEGSVTKVSGRAETTALVSVSFPFGRYMNAPMFASSINHNKSAGTSYLTSLSGLVGDSGKMNYSLNYSADTQQHINTINGSLQSRLWLGTVGISAANSKNYWQGSASMQGALVFHRGGVTAGPYLGDTFALIQADGAQGAKVVGGQGATIDRFGYALIPSLSPYRYNKILLDPEGMSANVELQDGQYQFAPYAGANVKVDFKTIRGYPVLISALRADTSVDVIPMGADVIDSDNKFIGMVGQGNQFYIRAEKMSGKLIVKWGSSVNEKCELSYDLNGLDLDQPLILFKALCH